MCICCIETGGCKQQEQILLPSPVKTPPTPTTSILSSNNSLIFFTFANAVYFTARPIQ